MGKNGASRNYTNRTYAEHSKTKTTFSYQNSRVLTQSDGRRKSSRLLKAVTK